MELRNLVQDEVLFLLDKVLKDIDDIRILRSDDSRIKSQMENLDKYVSVSKYPAIRRDLSISVDKNLNEEDICERIQDILEDKSVIEEICIVSETDYKDLPEIAIKRLNISDNQKFKFNQSWKNLVC